jgi:cobalt-zinc-cadmium efflux system outer membrane protein
MTWKVRASACLLASLLVGAGHAQAQDRPLTTAEVVQRALERNRDLLSARERVAEAQGLRRQAGMRLAPTVEIEAGTGRPLGTRGEEEYSASYFQPIETAGKRAKRVTVSQHSVTLAEAEVAERSRRLVFDVKTRIAELRAARRKSDAIARLLGASRESYRLTQARVAEGDAAALEERLLVTEVSRVDAQRATFSGRLASAVLNLGRLVGLPTGQGFTVADEPVIDRDRSLEDLKARAARVRPELLVARVQEEQAAAGLAVARAEGVPDLTASAKYTHRNSQFEDLYGFNALGALSPLRDRDNVLTVGLSIPVFTSNRNRGSVEAATARLSGARLHREYLEATIPQEIEGAYRRWAAAKETVALFQRGVIDQSERNLEVMRQAYTLGQLRLLDVLNEQRRLVDTELAYIDAQTELAEAAADLERTVGEDLP